MRELDFYTGRLGNRLFQIAYLYAQIKRGNIPDWYLQDSRYFQDFEGDIRRLFGEGIGYLEQVGIHVRRGKNPANPDEPNYSENGFYTHLCDTDYYEQAMAMFPDDDFLVFSDDPEWCTEKWKNNVRVQVMDRGNDIEDFNLFASCKSQIIANSSWSYWGSYLNPNPSKQVIAPLETKYYADGVVRTKYPKEFKQIDFNVKK